MTALLAWLLIATMIAVSLTYLADADRPLYETVLIIFALPLLVTAWTVAYVGYLSYRAAISGFKEAHK